jgi:hypothetical protein
VIATPPAIAADWPQWRGPDRDGKSPETGLLQEWPAEGPAVAWKASGSGSAAISYGDGRLYLRNENGRTNLVEVNPRKYRERGTFVIPDVVKPSWAHPVIANGKLLLHEQDVLHCCDITAASACGASQAVIFPTRPQTTDNWPSLPRWNDT